MKKIYFAIFLGLCAPLFAGEGQPFDGEESALLGEPGAMATPQRSPRPSGLLSLRVSSPQRGTPVSSSKQPTPTAQSVRLHRKKEHSRREPSRDLGDQTKELAAASASSSGSPVRFAPHRYHVVQSPTDQTSQIAIDAACTVIREMGQLQTIPLSLLYQLEEQARLLAEQRPDLNHEVMALAHARRCMEKQGSRYLRRFADSPSSDDAEE